MNSYDQEQVRSARTPEHDSHDSICYASEQAIASMVPQRCEPFRGVREFLRDFTYVRGTSSFFILDRSIPVVKSIQLDPLLIILPIWYKVLSISSQYLSLYVIVVLL